MLALRFILDRHVINVMASHCKRTNTLQIDEGTMWLYLGGDAICTIFGRVKGEEKEEKEGLIT